MAQKFDLENIYNFDQDYIDQLLALNGRKPIGNVTDRLAATILLYNGGHIIETDGKYVTDNIFNKLYMYPDDTLAEIAQNNDITLNVNRIELIRKIIDKYNKYGIDELNEK